MKKKFYFPSSHLNEWQFDRALAFTRTHPKTQAIARSYLVNHLALAVITTAFSTTRQNVFRAVKKLKEDTEIALQTIYEIQTSFDQLKLQEKTKKLTHFFIFTEETLEQASKRLKVTTNKILSAVRLVIKKHYRFINQDKILEREQYFNEVLPFSRAGEKSINIAYSHVVLLEPLVEVAKKHNVTKQNAYNILQRFKEAEERYKKFKEIPD